MLCRYSLASPATAEAIEGAVSAVLAAGYRTADLAARGEAVVGSRRRAEEDSRPTPVQAGRPIDR